MQFKFVLGIDVSKEWFNFCLMKPSFEILLEGKVDNTPEGIYSFIEELTKYLKKGSDISSLFDVLLCMEHTGIYIQHLTKCWLSKGGQLSVIHASKISEHLAGKISWEEKDDEIDARRIAEYAFRYGDKLQGAKIPDHIITKLQRFQRQRDRLNKVINLLEVPVNECKEFDCMDISQALLENQAASLKALKEDIKRLEHKMTDLIESDFLLKKLFKLVTSVEGVGPVIAREIIIATAGFTDFLPDQAKSFAKYCGIVPVKKQSGKSVRKRSKITKRCHKKLKSLLTLGARSLINTHNDLGYFYERKMKEGKHHLSIINAMRNKMILRVFAVVRNQVMYQKNLNLNAN